jgi:ATP-dependent HslUV protease ATP-binding subunit HslU
VQRDLLPLVEGTTVATKYGPVKTDHILFIASGAFPRLQAVGPAAGTAGPAADPRRIAGAGTRRFPPHPDRDRGQPDQAVCGADGDRRRDVSFTDDAIDALADIAVDLNATIENIGARRLQTVMERVLDEISFTAPDQPGQVEAEDPACFEALQD